MLERINLILKSRNLNAAQFADEISVQRSSVSHILTGRNNASLDFLLKVLKRYPEIDTDWLLTGKGVMMRSAATNNTSKNEIKTSEPRIAPIVSIPKESSGDLFKQSYDFQEITKDRINIEDPISPEVITDPYPQLEEKAQKKPDVRDTKTTSARLIEKIVIFYSDKSFGEYKPEG